MHKAQADGLWMLFLLRECPYSPHNGALGVFSLQAGSVSCIVSIWWCQQMGRTKNCAILKKKKQPENSNSKIVDECRCQGRLLIASILDVVDSFSCTLTSSRWSFFVLPENYRMMNRAEIFCGVGKLLHHLPACTYVLFMCMWITYSSSTEFAVGFFWGFVSFKACRRITCTFPTRRGLIRILSFWLGGYPMCSKGLNVTALWLGSSSSHWVSGCKLDGR
jgi:hypothetical protein